MFKSGKLFMYNMHDCMIHLLYLKSFHKDIDIFWLELFMLFDNIIILILIN